jgi:hypothetical protein
MYVFVFLVQLEIRIYLINIVIQPTHYLSLMQELKRERERRCVNEENECKSSIFFSIIITILINIMPRENNIRFLFLRREYIYMVIMSELNSIVR